MNNRQADRAIHRRRNQGGFTLLEVLIAAALLALVFSMTFSLFSGVMEAWRRGTELAGELQHGDYVMEQLSAALRSAAWSEEEAPRFGFRLENRGDHDEISWVTASPAFAGPHSPWRHGQHRIYVTVPENTETPGFAVKRVSPFADAETVEAQDYEIISPRITGLDCRVYAPEQQQWLEDWEPTNSIPALLEITLTLARPEAEEAAEPLLLQRLIEIPVAERIAAPINFSADATAAESANKRNTPRRTEPSAHRSPPPEHP